jgi:hypothetical protein
LDGESSCHGSGTSTVERATERVGTGAWSSCRRPSRPMVRDSVQAAGADGSRALLRNGSPRAPAAAQRPRRRIPRGPPRSIWPAQPDLSLRRPSRVPGRHPRRHSFLGARACGGRPRRRARRVQWGAWVLGELVPDSQVTELSDHSWSPGLRLLPRTVVGSPLGGPRRIRSGPPGQTGETVPERWTLLAIEERTAIVGDGGRWQVFGSGTALVGRGGRWRTFRSGGSLDLDAQSNGE